MIGIRFAHPAAFALLLLPAAFVLLYRFGDRRRREALLRFAPGNRPALAGSPAVDPARSRRFVIAAAVVLVFALAKPVWIRPALPAKTGDVVFLLDVSRSMLSRDASPSRLVRARQIVSELTARFRGERAALVTFAGNASVDCPLTVDYEYFRDRLSVAAPASVSRGGTRIGDAIRFALDNGFDNVRRGRKVLVLLTDGGDQQSTPEAASRAAILLGIRVLTVGIGDENASAIVPASEDNPAPFLYRGEPVHTQLDAAFLRRIGTYLAAENLDSASVYRDYLAQDGAPITTNEREVTPFLLALALTLLILEKLPPLPRFALPRPTIASLAFALLLFNGTTTSDLVRQGSEAFRENRLSDAQDCFERADSARPNSPEILYDLAATFYAEGSFGEALPRFERAAALARDPHFAAKCKVGAANCQFRMASVATSYMMAWHVLESALASYKSALAMDPQVPDGVFNRDVTRHWLDTVQQHLRAEADQFLVRSAQEKERAQHNQPGEILDQNKPGIPGLLKAPQPVDRDW